MDDEKRRSWSAGIARLRSATPEERLRAAADQRRIGLELLRGGLRAGFPHLTESELESKIGEVVFGRRAWQEICDRRRRRPDGPGPA